MKTDFRVHSTSVHPTLLAMGVACLALAYFGAGLAAREVTLLESQDLSIAAELFRTYRLSADHSPLHFVLLNLWLRTGGLSVPLLRFPSAVCVALAAAVVFRLAYVAAGNAAAAWASLVFVSNPEIADQARSLRLYGLAVLLCAVCFERAYTFGFRRATYRTLVGFLAGAVLAVHTHLFLWLWVLPLSVLVAVRAAGGVEGATKRRVLASALVATVLALPQVVHGFLALGFTHDRHAVYTGVSSTLAAFVAQVGRHLALGESPEVLEVPGLVLAVIALVPVLGLARLPWRAAACSLMAVTPPFAAALWLSATSEVEARYLCFALPGLAVLAGLGLAAMPFVPATAAGVALIGLGMTVTARAYGEPHTDWHAGADRLKALARDGDVVAVFPGYWAETFRFYTRVHELVPVTYPADLERVLLRGRRVLLVKNDGRDAGDIQAYLDAFTVHHPLFATAVRHGFAVEAVRLATPLARSPEHAFGTIVLAGVVGAGGYPWSRGPDAAAAFESLRGLFESGDVSVVGYAPLRPPFAARVLLGPAVTDQLRPDRAVAASLSAAGARLVVTSGEHGDPAGVGPLLAAARIAAVPTPTGNQPAPMVYELGSERVALLSLGNLPDGPSEPFEVSLVAQTRARLRPTDALVIFVPQPATLDSMPAASERELYRRLVDAGATVVVGQGAYSARPVERYREGVIAYSLGTLLLPPTLDLVQREATGIALRVQLRGGQPSVVDVLPVTFDDRSVPRLGRVDGVPAEASAAFMPLLAAFEHAHATARRDGEAAPRDVPYGPVAPPAAWERLVEKNLRTWIAWSSRGTSSRPFAATFSAGRSFAGVRGVRSLGVPRVAIEMDASPGTSLTLEFPPLPIGRRLEVSFALPDDREQSKFRPLLDEQFSLEVEGLPALTEPVPFQAGWRHVVLDTASVAHSLRKIRLTLLSPPSHFPVAFEICNDP